MAIGFAPCAIDFMLPDGRHLRRRQRYHSRTINIYHYVLYMFFMDNHEAHAIMTERLDQPPGPSISE
jgi:hypothetical protein